MSGRATSRDRARALAIAHGWTVTGEWDGHRQKGSGRRAVQVPVSQVRAERAIDGGAVARMAIHWTHGRFTEATIGIVGTRSMFIVNRIAAVQEILTDPNAGFMSTEQTDAGER